MLSELEKLKDNKEMHRLSFVDAMTIHKEMLNAISQVGRNHSIAPLLVQQTMDDPPESTPNNDDFYIIADIDENDDNNQDINDDEVSVVDLDCNMSFTPSKPNALILSWKNMQTGIFELFPSDVQFPKLPLPLLIINWHCSNITKYTLPCSILRTTDVRHIKGGCHKLN